MTAEASPPEPAGRARKRTRQDAGERRKQLIGIGLDMLTRRPLHQVTIDEVATQAGISRSLLFHYFPTKRDYYAEVVRAASRRLLRAVRPADGMAADLPTVVDGYLAFIERRHEAYLGLFRGTGTDDWVHEIYLETRAALTDRLLDALGVAAATPLQRVAVGSWLSFAEDLALHWAQYGTGTRERVLELMTGTLRAAITLAGDS